jgi:hypothetical protein
MPSTCIDEERHKGRGPLVLFEMRHFRYAGIYFFVAKKRRSTACLRSQGPRIGRSNHPPLTASKLLPGYLCLLDALPLLRAQTERVYLDNDIHLNKVGQKMIE